MPAKGSVCSKCGYVLRKWGVRCPICRTFFEDETEADVSLALAHSARKHLKKLEERRKAEGPLTSSW